MEMEQGLQPLASSKATWCRTPRLHLALISAVISLSCMYAVLGPHGLAFEFADVQQPWSPKPGHGIAGRTPPRAFECARPVPCPAVREKPTKLTGDDGRLDLQQIPLVRRSSTQIGFPGVCGVTESQRTFQESGVDPESLSSFEPCELFNLIQKRTLWIIGDSQVAVFSKALFAFTSAFGRTKEEAGRWGPIGIETLDYVLTYSNYKPECVNLSNETRICNLRLARTSNKEFQYVMEILAHAIPEFRHDVVVFNFGVHYRPVPYLLIKDLQAVADYREEVRNTMGPGRLPLTLWIDTAPQHFSTAQGGYDPDKNMTTDKCAPFSDERLAINADRGEFNAVSDPYLASVSDAHVRTWDMSKRAYFAHNRVGDCTHYCRPGVPELWIYALTKTLAKALPACG